MAQQRQMWEQHRNGRSNKAKASEMPKNDHPATFEQSIPPYAYPAQDGVNARLRQAQEGEQQRASTQQARQTQSMYGNQRFSPDGDAMEHGYRPYKQYNYGSGRGVPLWARPQRGIGNKPVRLLVLILLGIALLHALPAIAAVVLTLLGVVVLAIFLPFIIIFAGVAAFAVLALIVLKVLGIPLGRRGMFYRKRWGW
jgi:hypothetical protein